MILPFNQPSAQVYAWIERIDPVQFERLPCAGCMIVPVGACGFAGLPDDGWRKCCVNLPAGYFERIASTAIHQLP